MDRGQATAVFQPAMAAAQLPPRPCPVCKVAMQCDPVDPEFGYDIFVCNNCSTKVLIHHRRPDDEE